jgi:hypothetical protein
MPFDEMIVLIEQAHKINKETEKAMEDDYNKSVSQAKRRR